MPRFPIAPHRSGAAGLVYHEFGDPSGKPVVFHHGWPSAGSQGQLLDEAAKELGVRVLSPNRPGIGGSDLVPGRGFQDWPDQLGRFLDDLGITEPVGILGMSGGGPYALSACWGMPDRISKAGIVCGAGEIGGNSGDLVWPYRAMIAIGRKSPQAVGVAIRLGHWLTTLSGDFFGPRSKIVGLPECDRAVLAIPEKAAIISESYSESMSGKVAGVVADGQLYVEPWGFDPAEIAIPVRFWHGKLDKNILPRLPEALECKIPGGEIEWFEEDGHYSLPLLRPRMILQQLLAT